MSTAWQPSLAGLTLPAAGRSHLTDAARSTLAALDAAGALSDEHALTVQLILDLSAALDAGLGSGRLSVATSQAVRQLLDAMATLPAAPDAASAEVARFEAALRSA